MQPVEILFDAFTCAKQQKRRQLITQHQAQEQPHTLALTLRMQSIIPTYASASGLEPCACILHTKQNIAGLCQ
jgi:hypothetical protein